MIRSCIVAALGLVLVAACYPKVCDPAKDPLQCQCPSGPCGPYPSAPADAGADQ